MQRCLEVTLSPPCLCLTKPSLPCLFGKDRGIVGVRQVCVVINWLVCFLPCAAENQQCHSKLYAHGPELPQAVMAESQSFNSHTQCVLAAWSMMATVAAVLGLHSRVRIQGLQRAAELNGAYVSGMKNAALMNAHSCAAFFSHRLHMVPCPSAFTPLSRPQAFPRPT